MELAVAGEILELSFDRGQNHAHLFGRLFAVLSGKHPQRDRCYLELDAPFEEIVELVGAEHVEVVEMGSIYSGGLTVGCRPG
jgi:hypothetical protein